MTVVIMAACYDKQGPETIAVPHIIAACDTLLTTTTVSRRGDEIVSTIEDGYVCKIQKDTFNGRWFLGYSGDSAPFLEICDRLRLLAHSGDFGQDDVPHALARAYEEYREYRIQREILSNYRVASIAEFMQKGLKRFGEVTFDRLCQEIQRFDLGIDFVGGGFNQYAAIQLFRVVNPGVMIPERIGSGTVSTGTGAWIAEERLRLTYTPHAALHGNIAKVLDAKLAAEKNPFVGERTTALVINPVGNTHMVPAESINTFRDAWKRRCGEVPGEMADAITLTQLFNM